jgi:hypothetical protein
MSKTLVLLQTLGHLRRMEQVLDPASSDALLVVADNAVALALEERGIAFLDETAQLDVATAEGNLIDAPRVARRLAQRCAEVAAEQHLPALPDFSGDLQQPIEMSLNASAVYSRIMDEHVVGAVLMFSGAEIGMTRNGPAPAFVPAACITRAVLRHLAEQRGLSVRVVTDDLDGTNRVHPWRPRVALSDRNPSQREQSRSAAPYGKRTALIWRDGMWPAEITTAGDVMRDLGLTVFELSKADLELFVSQVGLESREDAEFAGRLAAILESECRAESRNPEVFANPHLRFQLAATAVEITQARALQRVFDAIVASLRPSVVVVGHDAFTVERALEQTCTRHMVPVVSLFHGGLTPLSGDVGLLGAADITAIWSRDDRERLAVCGFATRALVEIGSLRFDDRYRADRGRNGQPRFNAPSRRHPVGQRTIVILTSPTHVGSGFPTVDVASYRKAWKELSAAARRRSDWRFVIRPHPAFDQLEYFAGIVRETSGNVIMSTAVGIEEALRDADLAVLMNYCSTAAIDALFADIPLLFVSSALRPSAFVQDPLRSSGIAEVSDPSHLEDAIERLLQPGAPRTLAIENGKVLLSRIVGDNGTPARARFKCLLHSASRVVQTAPPTEPAAREPATWASSHEYQISRGLVGSDAELSVDSAIAMATVLAGWRVEPRVTHALFAELHRELRRSRIPGTTRRGILLAGYLLAIRKRLEEKQWERAAHTCARAVAVKGVSAWRSRDYWLLAIKSLIMWRPTTHRMGNWAHKYLEIIRRGYFAQRTTPS